MDTTTQIREKIDIVAFISEFITLKKVGRNFTTACPFHNEKSPSFVVSPERQIWHCFGCGKGGDVFTFLMEYENMEFIEALRTLAKRTGIELADKEYASASSKKEVIYKLNKEAADYYNYVLTKHKAGEKALSYLIDERKLNDKLINTFRIGFAPTAGTSLSDYLLNKKKHKKEDVLEAGLSSQKGYRLFDFFRGRIIFPLIDHRDNIVGFSGRAMGDEMPKYINTRETLTYHKGSMFFGLHMAKEQIKKENSAIVMEGEFDVIASFKEGIGNTVALKGTALTEQQALLLSRFTTKISMCLDMDSAGMEAIKRSLPVLEKRGLTTSVIISPNGKDPDESIKENPIEFKKSVKNDIPVYDFLVNEALKKNYP